MILPKYFVIILNEPIFLIFCFVLGVSLSIRLWYIGSVSDFKQFEMETKVSLASNIYQRYPVIQETQPEPKYWKKNSKIITIKT